MPHLPFQTTDRILRHVLRVFAQPKGPYLVSDFQKNKQVTRWNVDTWGKKAPSGILRVVDVGKRGVTLDDGTKYKLDGTTAKSGGGSGTIRNTVAGDEIKLQLVRARSALASLNVRELDGEALLAMGPLAVAFHARAARRRKHLFAVIRVAFLDQPAEGIDAGPIINSATGTFHGRDRTHALVRSVGAKKTAESSVDVPRYTRDCSREDAIDAIVLDSLADGRIAQFGAILDRTVLFEGVMCTITWDELESAIERCGVKVLDGSDSSRELALEPLDTEVAW